MREDLWSKREKYISEKKGMKRGQEGRGKEELRGVPRDFKVSV